MAIPTLIDLVVSGSSVALRYSEALSSTLPSFNRFIIKVNGKRVYATGPATLSADGTTILLKLADPVAVGAKVTIAYGSVNGADKPGFGDIQSRATAQKVSFLRDTAATNLTLAPTLAISSSASTLKAGETATISFSFSEVPSGFTAADIATSGGSLSGLTVSADPKIYTATFTPTAGSSGTASFSVAAGSYTDAAGNVGGAITTPALSYDTLAPTLAISSDKGTLKAGETATILFSFSEIPSGFDASDIATSGGSLSALSSTADPQVFSALFTPTPGAAGTAAIVVAAGSYSDAAGNSTVTPTDLQINLEAGVVSLSVGLSASSDTGTLGDGITSLSRISLIGQGQGGVTVSLRGTALRAVISGDGAFQLTEVPLETGDNVLTLDLLDGNGNSVASRELPLTLEAPAGGTSPEDPVLAWNRVALEAIRRDASLPPHATRALAMQAIAVLDTLAAIDGTPAFLVGLDAPAGVPAGAAVAAASARVLSYLYPSQKNFFLEKRETDLQAYTDAAARQAAVELGEGVADVVIALRDNDGWDRFAVEDIGNQPGQWRPTPPAFDLPQAPHWAQLTPFSLQSGSQFRPDEPPALTSGAYAEALNEVKSLGSATSSTRTAEQTQIARFWADGLGSYSPPGHWNQIADQQATADGFGYGSAARLIAILNVALADSSIASWDAKYAYDLWRPVTAIRNADSDGNPETTAESDWQPLLITPNHPEYVSGHSTYSAAAAEVLTKILGDRAFDTTSIGLPNVSRSFSSFEDAAAEAGRSRIYGGIHYEFSNQIGQALGTEVAGWVLDAFRSDIDLRGPQLALQQASGQVWSNAPLLSGFAVDNLSGVKSLSVTLAGLDPQLLSVDGRGRFSLDVGALFGSLADGGYGLTFQAEDGAGNLSAPLEYSFQLDNTAPTLAITSLSDGGLLEAGARLIGSVDGTGTPVQSLNYRFNNGVARPLVFDSQTGTFDVPLSLGSLAIGDQLLTLTAQDGAGLSTTTTLTLRLPDAIPLTIEAVSPADGTGEVGATFRPEVSFSRAVDPATVTGDSFWATDAAGNRLQATIVMAPQGNRAWLLFDGALPGSTRINLQLDGSKIRAAGDGQLLDADGNGIPGGTWSSAFTTVNLTPVAGTTLVGKVVGPGADLKPMSFDDFRAGPDGAAHTADDVFLEPLAGVKVFILGLEDRAVFTDAQGRFELKDVPVGVVKVAIDGRTATNPPTDVFYPEMVMDVTIRPAQVNTIMGTMGTTQEQLENFSRTEVYLPRISTKVLTAISPDQPTTVTTPAEGASNLTEQQRQLIQLVVQPGSVIGENGQVLDDAKVGIATVPPELVRDMLPPGLLQHTFDLTIQAPGAAVFSTPLQLTLPNVFNAPPGTKLNLLSFDHTTGRLVIDGTGTVSVDGQFVVTDPDSGVTRPGWHGMTPPGVTPRRPDVFRRDPKPAEPEKPDEWNTAEMVLKEAEMRAVATGMGVGFGSAAGDHLHHFLSGSGDNITYKNGSAISNEAKGTWEYTRQIESLNNRISEGIAKGEFKNGSTYEISFPNFNFYDTTKNLEFGFGGMQKTSVKINNLNINSDGSWSSGIEWNTSDYYEFDANDAPKSRWDKIGRDLQQCGAATPYTTTIIISDSISSGTSPSPKRLIAQPLGLFSSEQVSSRFAGVMGDSFQFVISGETYLTTATGRYIQQGVMENMYIMIEDASGQVMLRQFIADASDFEQIFLPAEQIITINAWDPLSNAGATQTLITGPSGSRIESVVLAFRNMQGESDLDGDLLVDFAERACGTSITSADTDGDGISDYAEIQIGQDPLGGFSLPTGVVGSLALQGQALDLALATDPANPTSRLALVATGSGISVVDLSNALSPSVVASLQLNGNADSVAYDPSTRLAAVALGNSLAIVDLTTPAAPILAHTVAVAANQVEVLDGVAYVITGSSLQAYDLLTGDQRSSLSFFSGLTGLAREGNMFYLQDQSNRIHVVESVDGTGDLLLNRGSIALPYTVGSSGERKLFVAEGTLYVPADDGFQGGFATVDVSTPSAPVVLSGPDDRALAGKAIALTGSGRAVIVGNPGGVFGTNVADVINTSDPLNTGAFITRINMSARPNDVVIANGFAFVATDTGLQVVNFLPRDVNGIAPTLSIDTTGLDIDPTTPGLQVQDGSTIPLKLNLVDDVLVSSVDVLINGQVVGSDNSYPFDLRTKLPTRAANGGSDVTLQVRATDTGGNIGFSEVISLTLSPDTIAPSIVERNVQNGDLVGRYFRSFRFTFSEGIELTAPVEEVFRLIPPVGATVTGTTVVFRNNGRQLQLTVDQLPAGAGYQLELDSSKIRDGAGNILGSSVQTTSFDVSSYDTITFGTTSSDYLQGGPTLDYISGGPRENPSSDIAPDYLYGYAGDDALYGYGGYDYLYGGNGNDLLDLGTGGGYANGEAGNDSLLGGDGSDYLYGGGGLDSLYGGAANDNLDDGDQAFEEPFYNPENGHWYQLFTSSSSLTWDEALATAAVSRLGDRQGYLATITTPAEQAFLSKLFGINSVWLGGSDAAEEGTWRWINGPENGSVFYINGQETQPGYSNWSYGEPNNSGNEDALHWFSYSNFWNDLPPQYQYWQNLPLIEYGGLSTDGSSPVVLPPGDLFNGGAGDDTINSRGGNDSIDGGEGTDRLDLNLTMLSQAVILDLSDPTAPATLSTGGTVVNVESFSISTGRGNDLIRTGAGNDNLYGGDGNDSLYGGAGYDNLYGQAGNDLLDLGNGAGYDYGNGGYADGGAGDDQLLGGDGSDNLQGGDGNDSLAGGAGYDNLYGGAGDDLLDLGNAEAYDYDYGNGGYGDGGAGNDSLLGGDGSDNLQGGGGLDSLYGGAGNDYLYDGDQSFEDPVYNPDNGHWYQYVQVSGSWSQARDAAALSQLGPLGGYLVTVTSAEEQAFINTAFGNLYYTWIGASDADSQGSWTWVTGPEAGLVFTIEGAPPTGAYNNWQSGQPGNSGPSANSGATYSNNGWYAFNGAYDYASGYIVEYGAPGDSTTVLQPRGDLFDGGAGDDTINSRGGNDSIDGGEGNDRFDLNLTMFSQDVILDLSDPTAPATLSTGGTVVNVESFSISTGRGNDLIRTGAGNDNLYGGDGNDSLYGGAGYDNLYGGAGDDLLDLGNGEGFGNGGDGGAGDDQLLGGDDSDNLQGGDGNDSLAGGAGYDNLYGGAGDDLLDLGAGDIYGNGGYGDGGAGNDSLLGGDGSDNLQGGGGLDSLYGGAGNDYLSDGDGTFEEPVFNPDNGHWYQYVQVYGSWSQARDAAALSQLGDLDGYLVTVTSAEEQAFINTAFANLSYTWIGASDADTQGSWTWVTGPEAGLVFTIEGVPPTGAYNNWQSGQPGNSGPSANSGAMLSNNGWYAFDGAYNYASGYIVEYGAPGDSTTVLQPPGDLFDGGAGDDTINSRGGNDSIDGGEGNDRLDLNLTMLSQDVNLDLSDPTAPATLSTGVTVVNVESFSISSGRGNDSIRTGAGNDNFYGGDGNDSLYGGAGYDNLHGQAGNDLLDLGNGAGYDYGNGGYADGGAGDDQLLGGDGSDNLQGGDGNDSLAGGAGYDNLYGGAGDDLLDLGAGDIYGNGGYGDGGAGNDSLLGGDGSDNLQGGGGLDSLYGGAGNDYLSDGDQSFEDPVYNPDNGHWYQYVQISGSWSQARDAAALSQLGPLGGYLVTVTSAEEQAFINTAFGNLYYYTWIGASDADTQGSWTWVTGPEAGLVFTIEGAPPTGAYNNWQSGQPGNSGPTANSGAMLDFYSNNGWYAFDSAYNYASGYIVEYGAPGDITVLQLPGDLFDGGAGDDSITSRGVNDIIDGGEGTDRLDMNLTMLSQDVILDLSDPTAPATLSTGGTVVNVESFSISTGRGNDLIRTGAGNDNLYGGDGNDSLYGGAGYDYLYGEAGNDLLDLGNGEGYGNGGYGDGGAGDDQLLGGDGNDSLYGGAGYDYLYGQAGNYFIELGNGEGYDYGNGGYADGGAGDDQLLGGDGSDNLQGGDGNDLLTGGMNSDWLTGGDGSDIFSYLNPNEGADVITDFNGNFDSIQVSAAGFGGGLVAGMDLLASGRYVENSTGLATSAAGIGQFIYLADYNQLYWDVDGEGGLSTSVLSTLSYPVNWSASSLQVLM